MTIYLYEKENMIMSSIIAYLLLDKTSTKIQIIILILIVNYLLHNHNNKLEEIK
jgi:hypothetical protein